jgi:hypothetical protein
MKAIKTFRDLLFFLHATRLGKTCCSVAALAEAVIFCPVMGGLLS